MSADLRFVPHPDAVLTVLAPDSATVLHLVSKRYYTLNGTAIRIWQLLEQLGTVDAVAQALSDEYEIEVDAARDRVDSLVAELRAEGLVRVSGEP